MAAGLRNLAANRTTLGWKKTVGKILQPINTYTRFAEYEKFHSAIWPEVSGHKGTRAEVLDVGSPKLFGLYLASRYATRAHLTDLREGDLEEYSIMWSALSGTASGEALLEKQDARALSYADSAFDIVYSMSAIEHVEGAAGDSRAMGEMWRVLKPAGLLVVSVPFGHEYIEQAMMGFSYTATLVDRHKSYFFQRIYDKSAVQDRLLSALEPRPQAVHIFTIHRSRAMSIATVIHKARALLGLNLLGLVGFLNPMVSALLNRDCEGYGQGVLASYGPVHSLADIYADLVVICRKAPQGSGSVRSTGSESRP